MCLDSRDLHSGSNWAPGSHQNGANQEIGEGTGSASYCVTLVKVVDLTKHQFTYL